MDRYKHVVWELVLILASVLFFRSLWLLLDKYLVHPNGDLVLVISLLIGTMLAGVAFYVLAHDKRGS